MENPHIRLKVFDGHTRKLLNVSTFPLSHAKDKDTEADCSSECSSSLLSSLSHKNIKLSVENKLATIDSGMQDKAIRKKKPKEIKSNQLYFKSIPKKNKDLKSKPTIESCFDSLSIPENKTTLLNTINTKDQILTSSHSYVNITHTSNNKHNFKECISLESNRKIKRKVQEIPNRREYIKLNDFRNAFELDLKSPRTVANKTKNFNSLIGFLTNSDILSLVNTSKRIKYIVLCYFKHQTLRLLSSLEDKTESVLDIRKRYLRVDKSKGRLSVSCIIKFVVCSRQTDKNFTISLNCKYNSNRTNSFSDKYSFDVRSHNSKVVHWIYRENTDVRGLT